MTTVLGVIIGLIILTVLVVIHEAGHAVAALRNKVVVEEFGVGFPPRVFARKLKNGILLSINALPIGGFVKLQGENESASKKGDYGAATFWQKTKILLAGVLVNWLFAAILLSVLAIFGLPKIVDNQFVVASDNKTTYQPVTIVSTIENYPASKAGIKSGDQILSFAGQKILTVSQLLEVIKANKGRDVSVVYDRDGLKKSAKITLRESSNGNGLFGAGLGQNELIKSTWSAPIVGVATTAQFTYLTFQGLGSMISNLANGVILQFSSNSADRKQAQVSLNDASQGVAGPIGILGTLFPAAEKSGLTQVIFLTAIISLSLAVMNILPIPALDGGRWLTMALFKVSKKELTQEREEKIQTIGFYLILLLMIVFTAVDVSRII